MEVRRGGYSVGMTRSRKGMIWPWAMKGSITICSLYRCVWKLFEVVAFSHVMHLAAQASVWCAMDRIFTMFKLGLHKMVFILTIRNENSKNTPEPPPNLLFAPQQI
ncbi:unnamed protein product, partial [Vitis vinifera]